MPESEAGCGKTSLLLPLPECSFHLLSVSSFSSCAAGLHQPTQCEFQENKSVAATRGKKSVKRQFHICGQKRCALHTQAFHCNQSACNFNTSISQCSTLSFLSVSYVAFILNIMSIFPRWFSGPER